MSNSKYPRKFSGDRNVRVGAVLVAADHVRERKTVNRRHLPIDDDEIDGPRAHDLKRFGASRGFRDLRNATRAQQTAHEKAHLLVVIDNQHVNVIEGRH